MTKRLDVLVNLIKQGNGDKAAKSGLEGIELSSKEAEISVKALNRRYSQLITEVSKGNKTVDQAQREYRDFARQLNVTERAVEGVGDAGQKAGLDIVSLNQAVEFGKTAFNSAAQAIEVAYDALQEGAQIQATALTFDSLAESVNSASDVMLGDLQAATRGTIDDMTLMQSASQFTAMGLANNAEEAAKLAQVGSRLGAAFRGDAAAGMEEFALLLANQSIPRLDSFGISAGAVRSRIAELTEATPGLSREQAFMTAVMEESEKTMAKLGDSTSSAAENLAILESSAENTKDAFLAATTEGVNPFLTSMVNLVTLSNETGVNKDEFWSGFAGGVANSLENSRRGLDTLTTSLRVISRLDFDNPIDFWNSLNGAVPRLQIMDDALAANAAYHEYLNEQMTANNEAMVDFTAETQRLTRAQLKELGLLGRSTDATERMADSHDQLAPAVRNSTDAIGEASDAIDYLSVRQDVLSDALQRSADATIAHNATLGEYFVEASRAGDETLTASEQFYELATAGDLGIDAIRTLSTELGIMSPAMADNYFQSALLKANMDDLIESIRDGELASEDADLALDALTSGFADTAEEAIAAAKAANIFGDSMDDIPDVTVKKLIFDVSQTGAVTVGQIDDPFGPAISSHYGGPAAAGQPYLVGDGPGGSFIPGATELFIPGQSGHIVSNRQVEQALASMTDNSRSFTDRSTVNFNLRGNRATLREAKRQRHRRTARSMGRLING